MTLHPPAFKILYISNFASIAFILSLINLSSISFFSYSENVAEIYHTKAHSLIYRFFCVWKVSMKSVIINLFRRSLGMNDAWGWISLVINLSNAWLIVTGKDFLTNLLNLWNNIILNWIQMKIQEGKPNRIRLKFRIVNEQIFIFRLDFDCLSHPYFQYFKLCSIHLFGTHRLESEVKFNQIYLPHPMNDKK